jgi:hypothetical protein
MKAWSLVIIFLHSMCNIYGMSTARASTSDFLSLCSTSLASVNLCVSMMTCRPRLLAILTKSAMSFLVPILLPFTIFYSNVGKLATLPRTPRTTMPPFLTDLIAASITLSDGAKTIALSSKPSSSFRFFNSCSFGSWYT